MAWNDLYMVFPFQDGGRLCDLTQLQPNGLPDITEAYILMSFRFKTASYMI